MKLSKRVLGITSILVLAVLVASFIVTTRIVDLNGAPQVKTEITLSSSPIEEDYAAYLERVKRKMAKFAINGLPNSDSHNSTSHDSPQTHDETEVLSDALYETDDHSTIDQHTEGSFNLDVESEYEALESEYQAALSSASPEVASMMEAIRAHVESLSPEEAINLDHNALIQQYLPD